MRTPITLALAALASASCQSTGGAPAPAAAGEAYAKTVSRSEVTSPAPARPDGWDEYWYAGLAEVNAYDLTQVRYGEARRGEAVLVFVTEPFLAESQVKDDGRPTDEESVSVLKLNRLHRFTTGIYDYSLMLSAFTPVSRDRFPHTLKTALSAQDWCGHSWFQLNHAGGDAYDAQRRSYFQAEADADRELSGVDLLEDELPALVRLDPALVPTGELRVVPGAMFSSLQHVMPEPRTATLATQRAGGTIVVTIAYADLGRELAYTFDADFPYVLRSWRETAGGELLSGGTLRATRRSAYWGENATRFAPLRDTLGLQ